MKEFIYLVIILLLFLAELIYFKIADKYNIIDKPNHRSAHTQVTLRGGGIIFPIAFILFSLFNFNEAVKDYWAFGLGMLAICIISFIDDVKPLSNKLRLTVQFISVVLLLDFINAFALMPFWVWPIMFIVIVGTLNAYNFMDGINGMTGLYSLVTVCSLIYINRNIFQFTDNKFIYYPTLACIVFLFFNFRKKAKCFAGDVGSMGIGFWIIGLITLLIMKTQDYKYILLLSVYGIEVVLTIIERIMLKENIFEAHRRHLYQLLANEKKIPHLLISFVYSFFQLLVTVFLIHSSFPLWIVALIVFLPVGGLYLLLKWSIKKQYNL
ncbi:Undecaprenyl-phosphate alpha-N-acetylglucosaminyl 1-phosphate transferase [Chryseobacterium gleum]|jgi:UDP-N-acetylmuramyl pentapeptide phosphotransferase/UDP-N-acetylglucosamine-1-phosphate transferase|uniref:Undecaprenyl-phosphate alpha-N-acetylglucosaminyl 1-phosphate transferase n=2 Tax=Chryseobacterium gleum TaxID=250 RepID=A0A3S4M6M3_CHRGE|nr:glycosyltransferase family 4 protein [Chryseobacterium gleum]EFK33080.1 glycosyltransferase, group 4 family [Chryseobacterium gleum ATCC 35910]QBJ86386.1 UDP-GlcNAc--UDP-phosphate GlcNAc-1-phosphate transferase [Chryseobacterium gleum]QQY33905.1 glycosyltransferase family 4 protein [Chryseobacterium gleum]VEE07748.1 Undecaprenyl-phosphate alpha-N-acetylglucosaminyl 1-phosphate transferase [Chryseobacterium gleum]